MYPAPAGTGPQRSSQPPKQPRDKRQRDKQPRTKPPGDRRSRKGFLITLLVIVVLAGAAAAVFFWYLPSRESDGASGLEARNLVRQAMITIDRAYTDTGTFDPATLTSATLQALTPDVTFNPVGDTSAATSPISLARDKAVDYAGTLSSYAIGTNATDGTAYGVVVEMLDTAVITYYLNGAQVDSWEQPAATDTTAAPSATDVDGGTTQTTVSDSAPAAADADILAMTLVRDSMTTVESASAGVGTFEPSQLTASLLQQMDPSTTFVIRDSDQAAAQPISLAAERSLDFFGTATSYSLGTTSASGTTFGVTVSTGANGRTTTYYVNGQVEDWSSRLMTPVVG